MIVKEKKIISSKPTNFFLKSVKLTWIKFSQINLFSLSVSHAPHEFHLLHYIDLRWYETPHEVR